MNDTDNRRCGTCGRVAFGGDVRRAPDGACCEEGGRACWRVTAANLRRENERLLATSQALAETSTGLRRELAEAHEKHAMEFQRADKYQAELAARTEELDAARKALRPFAAMWRQFAKDRPLQPSGDTAFYSAMKIPGEPAAELTPNHLRAADRALGVL